MVEVDASSGVQATTDWSVQLNVACSDGWLLQPVLQLYQGTQVYACFTNGGTGGISATHGSTPFDGTVSLPIAAAGDGIMLSLLDIGTDMLAMLWARQNGYLHGSPVYNLLGTGAHPIQNVAVDTSGPGGTALTAAFEMTSFEVNLKLDGVSDPAYYGENMSLPAWDQPGGQPNQGPGLPSTPPCPTQLTDYLLNSNEGDNLQRWITSIDAPNGFVQMAYNTT